MGDAYPELTSNREAVKQVVRTEEERFGVVLTEGLPRLEDVLDNAAHATLANGGRRIDVAIALRGTHLTFAVTDEGAGLDPAIRDEVGLRAVSTKEHGLGIGLLLSRAALQRFGGRLDLKDAPHGGVEAHIELPLDELLADAR